MINISKRLVFSTIIILFFLIQINFVFASQENYKYLTMATGGIGGVTYQYAGATAAIASRYTDLKITAEATGGSVENLELLKSGESDMALLMSDVYLSAYLGLKDYDARSNLRALYAGYPQIWHLITPADSDIKSYQDIRGKRVSVGPPGSGTEFMARQILESLGITYDDFRVEYLSNVEMVSGLKDGILDAAFFILSYEASAIIELDVTMGIRIIGLEDAEIDAITTKHPEYVGTVIPEGMYTAAKSDIPTVSCWNVAVATADLPEDVAYKYVKVVMEHLDELAASLPAGKYTAVEDILLAAMSPLHPGAIKYYEEIGLTIPDHLIP